VNAERLLQHFDRISEAPDAIPRLRRFILDLAIRGKLVKQDPNDEPAANLLKRIQAGSSEVKGRYREAKEKMFGVGEQDLFQIPASWQWVRFGNLIDKSDAGWSPTSENFPRTGDNWGVLKVSAVSWDRFRPEENKQLLPGVIPPKAAQVHAGDFLISRANTSELVAKSVVVEQEPRNIILSDKIVRLQINEGCCKQFLCMVNNHSEHARTYYAAEASGTSLSMKNVSRSVIYELPIPLPSLAEQHRIVAKVDELMSLCDQLEAGKTELEQSRGRLVAASLHHLGASRDSGTAEDREAFRGHVSFTLNNLPRLTTRPAHIKQLRQTMLNLAVRGKLVSRDPNDEPASDLLKRIQSEKSLLHAQSTTKTINERVMANTVGHLPQLPASWTWVRTETICETIVDCPHSTPVFVPRGIVCLDTNAFKNGAVIPRKVRYVSDETYKDRIKRLAPRAGDVVFSREGSVGESIIIPKGLTCCLGQRVMLFRLMPGVLPSYFRMALGDTSSLARLLALHKGIGARHVNVGDMRNAMIPLPPTAEQHRIVKKYNTLMALCEQLEGQLAETEKDGYRLLEAVLHQALRPVVEDDAELQHAVARSQCCCWRVSSRRTERRAHP
jgi:type I restriction enzyme, S subunit